MNCRDVQPWMDLPKEDVPFQLRQELEQHLKICSVCRETFETCGKLFLTLRALPVADPGEPFWIRFPDRVRQELAKAQKEAGTAGSYDIPRKRSFFRNRLLPLSAAAGVAALTLAAVYFLNRIELPQTAFYPDEEELAALEDQMDLPVETDDLPILLISVGNSNGGNSFYYGLQELASEDLNHLEQELQEFAQVS